MKILTSEELKADRLEERAVEKLAPSTGYSDLDRIIGGFIPGHVYMLSGETNAGKTSLAANFAIRVEAQVHRKVLYIALEPGTGILDFFVAIRSGKKFTEIEKDDYDKHWGTTVVAPKCSNIRDLISYLKKLPDSDNFDLIIIDHIGYFISRDNTNQEQANVMKQLAMIAKEKSVAIMPIAHTRKGESKMKRKRFLSLDDISGSAAFKQDATEVLMIQRFYEEPDNEENVTLLRRGLLNVLKTKRGQSGYIPIYFQYNSPLVKSELEEKYGDEPNGGEENKYI